MMFRRIRRSEETAGQLPLWAEEAPSPTPALPLEGGESKTAPSPSQGEGGDGGSATTPNQRPAPASPPKRQPLRAVAAARKDTIARSERALNAIRAILSSNTSEEAARHAAAFRRNR
jgi:hypothetical protein